MRAVTRTMDKCNKCKKETKKLRRGMCISCYRIHTGFSGGDPRLFNMEEELKKIKQRVLIFESKLKELRK